MPGGKGKINEYNKSLTPEERKKSAKKAASTPKKPKAKIALIRDVAKKINDAPAPEAVKDTLAEFGLKDEEMTVAAAIAFSVMRSALEGDLKAVEKWERYTGQHKDEREALENKLLKEKLKTMSGGESRAEPIQVIITPPDASGDEN